jgi:hypothetical protein
VVDQVQPGLGAMVMTENCSKMQTALIQAEAMSSSIIMSEAMVLEQIYNLQEQGDNSIPQPHSADHMLTIQYGVSIHTNVDGQGNITYSVEKNTMQFNDPGYPPPSVTGTQANEYENETEGTQSAFDTGMEAWEQAMEQGVTTGYNVVNMISDNSKAFVQFSSDANQAASFVTSLLNK